MNEFGLRRTRPNFMYRVLAAIVGVGFSISCVLVGAGAGLLLMIGLPVWVGVHGWVWWWAVCWAYALAFHEVFMRLPFRLALSNLPEGITRRQAVLFSFIRFLKVGLRICLMTLPAYFLALWLFHKAA